MPSEAFGSEEVEDGPATNLYAVYLTATIPMELLTAFVTESRHRDCFPIVITSINTHLGDHDRSTRLPIEPFQSPFLGMDLEAVAAIYRTQSSGLRGTRRGTGNFVILDEQTLRDRSVLVANLDDEIQTVRSDFDMALECLVIPELMGWGFDEFNMERFFYERITLTRELHAKAIGGERGTYEGPRP